MGRGVLLAALALLACQPALARDGLSVGKPAPDFALASLSHGNQRLSAHRGEFVAVVFWASWCGECRNELERWQRLQRRHAEAGLVVLGINVEGTAQAAQPLVAATGITLPTLLDAGGQVSKRYKPETLPLIVLVDRLGIVRATSGALRGNDQAHLDARLLQWIDE